MITLFSLIFVLCSCQNNDMGSFGDEEPSRHDEGGISHGVIVPDPIESDFTLSYIGEPITITYMLENGSSPNTWGFSIYTAGVLQPYSINGGQDSTMNIFEFDANERIEFQISFVPVIGCKGDLLPISFVVMLNPEYSVADTDTNYRYGIFHSISQMNWRIECTEDTGGFVESQKLTQNLPLPQSIVSRYSVDDEFGSEECLLDSTAIPHKKANNYKLKANL